MTAHRPIKLGKEDRHDEENRDTGAGSTPQGAGKEKAEGTAHPLWPDRDEPVFAGRYRLVVEGRADARGIHRRRQLQYGAAAGAYILVGIAAFVLGVVVTMLCIRYKMQKGNPMTRWEKKEESL